MKEFKAHETALLPLSKGDERLSVSVQLTVTPYAFAFHNPNSNFKLNAQVKFAQLKEALMHAGVGELSEIRKVGSRRNVRGKNSLSLHLRNGDVWEIELWRGFRHPNPKYEGWYNAYLTAPYINFDFEMFAKSTGRQPRIREAVKVGSLIRILKGTLYGECELDRKRAWGGTWDYRVEARADRHILVIDENRGRIIDAEGNVGAICSIRSHLHSWSPCGWGQVRDTEGIEILFNGDEMISHANTW